MSESNLILSDINKIIENYNEIMNLSYSEKMRAKIAKISSLETDIEYYKREYISYTKTKNRLQREIKEINNTTKYNKKQLENELKSILDINEVDTIKFDTSTSGLEIHTKEIEAYTREDVIVKIGKLIVEIDMIKGGVYVGTTCENAGGYGYWTNYDPHPHVNGENNLPCLGEVEFALTEAFANHNYFNMSVIMIEWLKSVNIDDPAGAKYKGWDWIDEDGVLHKKEKINDCKCNCCDLELSEEDTYTCRECEESVCSECTVYIKDGEYYVCDRCVNEFYEFCDTCNTWIHRDKVYFDRDNHAYCQECYDKIYTKCAECGEDFEYETMITDSDREVYCQDCYYDKYTTCDECGEEIFINKTLKSEDGNFICEDCYIKEQEKIREEGE